MIISESSVMDLNRRLAKPIKSVQLRPNVVVKDCDRPFYEDDWTWIKIGEAIVRNFKPCPR